MLALYKLEARWRVWRVAHLDTTPLWTPWLMCLTSIPFFLTSWRFGGRAQLLNKIGVTAGRLLTAMSGVLAQPRHTPGRELKAHQDTPRQATDEPMKSTQWRFSAIGPRPLLRTICRQPAAGLLTTSTRAPRTTAMNKALMLRHITVYQETPRLSRRMTPHQDTCGNPANESTSEAHCGRS